MKIEDILQKQGEIYHNLTRNKTIQKYNETIEKPGPVKQDQMKSTAYTLKKIKK